MDISTIIFWLVILGLIFYVIGIYNTLVNFQMPGLGIPGFLRRSIAIAKAGVYNLRIHHDRVLVPLLAAWDIEHLTGLTAHAAEIQDKLMALPAQVLSQAERFERRFATA